jgi:hypothetical protein
LETPTSLRPLESDEDVPRQREEMIEVMAK